MYGTEGKGGKKTIVDEESLAIFMGKPKEMAPNLRDKRREKELNRQKRQAKKRERESGRETEG